MVPGVGDVDIAVRVHGHAPRFLELAGRAPFTAKLHQGLAAVIELLDAVVAPVRHVNVPLGVHGDAPRIGELPRLRPLLAPSKDGVEFLVTLSVGVHLQELLIGDELAAAPVPELRFHVLADVHVEAVHVGPGAEGGLVLAIEDDVPQIGPTVRTAESVPDALERHILVALDRPPHQPIAVLVVLLAQVGLDLLQVLVAHDHHRRVERVPRGLGAVKYLVLVIAEIPLQRPGRVVVVGHFDVFITHRAAGDLLDLRQGQFDIRPAVSVNQVFVGVVVVDVARQPGEAHGEEAQDHEQSQHGHRQAGPASQTADQTDRKSH